MMKWFQSFFKTSEIKQLPSNYCLGKTNVQLLDELQSGKISRDSGEMIVGELLRRICSELERKND